MSEKIIEKEIEKYYKKIVSLLSSKDGYYDYEKFIINNIEEPRKKEKVLIDVFNPYYINTLTLTDLKDQYEFVKKQISELGDNVVLEYKQNSLNHLVLIAVYYETKSEILQRITEKYQQLLKERKLHNDEEYKQYLKLKKKFNDI